LCCLECNTRSAIMPAPSGAGEKCSAATGSSNSQGASYASAARDTGAERANEWSSMLRQEKQAYRPPTFGDKTWEHLTQEEHNTAKQLLSRSHLEGSEAVRMELSPQEHELLLSGPGIMDAARRELDREAAAQAAPAPSNSSERDFATLVIRVLLREADGADEKAVRLLNAAREAAQQRQPRSTMIPVIKATHALHLYAFEELATLIEAGEARSADVDSLMAAVRGCIPTWPSVGKEAMSITCTAERAAVFTQRKDVVLPSGMVVRVSKLPDAWAPKELLLQGIPADLPLAELGYLLLLELAASGIEAKEGLRLSPFVARGPADSEPWQRVAARLGMKTAPVPGTGTADGSRSHNGKAVLTCRTDVAVKIPAQIGVRLPSGALTVMQVTGEGVFACRRCGRKHKEAKCPFSILDRPLMIVKHPHCYRAQQGAAAAPAGAPQPAEAAGTQGADQANSSSNSNSSTRPGSVTGRRPASGTTVPRRAVPAQNGPPRVSAGRSEVTPRKQGAKRPAAPGSGTPQRAADSSNLNPYIALGSDSDDESDAEMTEGPDLRAATGSAQAGGAAQRPKPSKSASRPKKKPLPSAEQQRQALTNARGDLDERSKLVRKMLQPVVSALQREGFVLNKKHMSYLCYMGDEPILQLATRELDFGKMKVREHLSPLLARVAGVPAGVGAAAGEAVSEPAAAPTEQARVPTPTAEMDTAETESTAVTDTVVAETSAAAAEASAAAPANTSLADDSAQMEVQEAVTSPSRSDAPESELEQVQQTEQPMGCEQKPSDSDSSGAAGAGGHIGSNAYA
jgi:hypothetical protein